MLWKYGESSPLEVAMTARADGDIAIMEKALADANALANLRREARPQ